MFTLDVIQPSQHNSKKVISSFELWKLRLKEVIDWQRYPSWKATNPLCFFSDSCCLGENNNKDLVKTREGEGNGNPLQ